MLTPAILGSEMESATTNRASAVEFDDCDATNARIFLKRESVIAGRVTKPSKDAP
jgi:hypothetical protein